MRDYREYGIKRKLSSIRNIICVDSGKGGVGKSTIASILSLILSKRFDGVGLLDLDFHGPTCHLILGIPRFQYEEEDGIRPYRHDNILFASVYPFVGDKYIAMRGKALSNALIEFLAIINWGDLHVLVIDMPPGMGDVFLDVVRYFPQARHLIITTSSILSISTVSRLLRFLIDHGYDIIGIIENMKIEGLNHVERLAREYDIKHLGNIPVDQQLESSYGKADLITQTRAAKAIEGIVDNIIGALQK